MDHATMTDMSRMALAMTNILLLLLSLSTGAMKKPLELFPGLER